MKIGIIVYSNTGNTLSVAKNLEEVLIFKGHTVSIEKVTAVNEDPGATTNIVLKDAPDPNGYDVMIFASPVHGFSLAPVMKFYLSGLPSISGIKVGLFITQHFGNPFWGGNRAIKQMAQLCKEKGAVITKTGTVGYESKQKDVQLAKLIEEFSKI